MEKYDGPSALHFLSHNFEGHEIIAVTICGNPEIQQRVVQDIISISTKKYREAWVIGGNIRLCVQEMGEFHPCIYHIDIYYDETIDVDALLEQADAIIEDKKSEAYQNEYQKFIEALSQWTTYNDETGVAGQGGDE